MTDKLTTSQAIAEARKFAGFIKAFKRLTEVTDALEGVDQLIQERTAHAATLSGEIEQLAARQADVIYKTQELQTALDDIAADTQAERDKIMQTARTEAQGIVAKAVKELELMADEKTAASDELSEFNAQIDTATAALAEITEKLQKARGQARKILEE